MSVAKASKRILLTGASGGIGQAIAWALAEQGHQLLLVGRNETKLASLCQRLAGQHHYFVCDLDVAASRATLLLQLKALAPLDVLINNAGINEFGDFAEQDPERITQIIHTNVTSTILLTQSLLPLLAPTGQILTIGSTFGSLGFPGYVAYSASKFALRGFNEALRRELADSDILVSYLAPRGTLTELNSDNVTAMNQVLGSRMDPPERVANEVVALVKHPKRQRFIGYPEKLFVLLNQLFPKLIDSSLAKQLPTIKRFAAKTETRTMKEVI